MLLEIAHIGTLIQCVVVYQCSIMCQMVIRKFKPSPVLLVSTPFSAIMIHIIYIKVCFDLPGRELRMFVEIFRKCLTCDVLRAD
jgi:hypothetical protein